MLILVPPDHLPTDLFLPLAGPRAWQWKARLLQAKLLFATSRHSGFLRNISLSLGFMAIATKRLYVMLPVFPAIGKRHDVVKLGGFAPVDQPRAVSASLVLAVKHADFNAGRYGGVW